MLLKKKTILAGVLSTTILFTSNLSAFASQINSNSDSISSTEATVDIENHKISKKKMDSYREVYKIMNGSYDGFDEEAIQESADYLLSISNSDKTRGQIVSKYFNWIKWIKRSGVVSLSISPTTGKGGFLGITNSSVYAAAVDESWGIVYRNWSNSSKWKNTKSMQMQYICHTQFAKFKTPWNIEPHRTETNYAKVVAKGCNP